MDVHEQLEQLAQEVDLRLSSLLRSETEVPEQLHAAMRYSCLAPGKRIRPALCVACCEAVGGHRDVAIDAGCAIEMVHCFSLIHDDLPAIDNDDLRRGRPTCHKQFGEAVAILAGDALFAKAFETLSSLGAPADRVLKAVLTLTQATGSDGLVGGETVDILSENQPATSELLHYIHEKKTGALIAASCEIGAILGGASAEVTSQFRRYGELIGLAFQIADDVLNETSTPEALGKAAGSDRERGKVTYPALYGLEESRLAATKAANDGVAQIAGVGSEFLSELAAYTVSRLN